MKKDLVTAGKAAAFFIRTPVFVSVATHFYSPSLIVSSLA